MLARTRRSFSEEFKREAVRLAREPGRSLAGVARDLKIERRLLAGWRTGRRSWTRSRLRARARQRCEPSWRAFVGRMSDFGRTTRSQEKQWRSSRIGRDEIPGDRRTGQEGVGSSFVRGSESLGKREVRLMSEAELVGRRRRRPRRVEVSAAADLASRRIVGWSMSAQPSADLTSSALRMAIQQRQACSITRIEAASTRRPPIRQR